MVLPLASVFVNDDEYDDEMDRRMRSEDVAQRWEHVDPGEWTSPVSHVECVCCGAMIPMAIRGGHSNGEEPEIFCWHSYGAELFDDLRDGEVAICVPCYQEVKVTSEYLQGFHKHVLLDRLAIELVGQKVGQDD
jgi:hypothetical protein